MRGLIKKISVLILISIPYFAHSQSFLGPHLSQYDPLKAVYFNPASLPNSDMRWQVNILSADVVQLALCATLTDQAKGVGTKKALTTKKQGERPAPRRTRKALRQEPKSATPPHQAERGG